MHHTEGQPDLGLPFCVFEASQKAFEKLSDASTFVKNFYRNVIHLRRQIHKAQRFIRKELDFFKHTNPYHRSRKIKNPNSTSEIAHPQHTKKRPLSEIVDTDDGRFVLDLKLTLRAKPSLPISANTGTSHGERGNSLSTFRPSVATAPHRVG